jgi:hypothetical protein
MAAPTVTSNTSVRAAASLAASGTATYRRDIRTKFETRLQFEAVFGTVAATSGLLIEVFRHVVGGTTAPDTIPVTSLTVPSTASTTKRASLALPTGDYDVKITNLDATNAITTVSIFEETTDTVV